MRHFILHLLMITLAFFCCANTGSAQKRLDEKAKKKYVKVKELFKKKENEKALKELDELLEENPEFIEGFIRKGNHFIEIKDWDQAIEIYDHVIELDPDYHDERIWYTIAYAKRQNGDLKGALKNMDVVLSKLSPDSRNRPKIEKERAQLVFLKDALENPVPYDPVRLDTTLVNSPNHEYLPAFNADNTKMIFTRYVDGQEDLYEASLADGYFMEVNPIDTLNTLGNEGSPALSPDGRYLIFTACDRRDSKGGCDLYLSSKKNGVWSKAINMGSKFNSSSRETQASISVDGQTIFFVSERSGGKGGADIWFITTNDVGKYGTAQNLGGVINTRGNESSPFIHPDGKTLYFRSDYHPGMGNYDLFMSKKDKDGNWSPPINLGYPINTKDEEGALFVTLDGKTAYFATDQSNENKDSDILSFDLPEDLRPNPTSFLRVFVTDAVDKEALAAKLQIVNLGTGEKYNHVTDANSGKVLSALPAGAKYSVNVESAGHLFYSKHIDIEEVVTALEPYIINVELQRIPKPEPNAPPVIESKPVVLENIFFESGSSKLLDISYGELYKLEKLLKNNNKTLIKIIGHTDNVGSPESNQSLSEERAKSVYNALVALGITEGRITYEGKGETMPIEDNDSEEGRRKNRRTEFVLISNQ